MKQRVMYIIYAAILQTMQHNAGEKYHDHSEYTRDEFVKVLKKAQLKNS